MMRFIQGHQMPSSFWNSGVQPKYKVPKPSRWEDFTWGAFKGLPGIAGDMPTQLLHTILCLILPLSMRFVPELPALCTNNIFFQVIIIDRNVYKDP